VFERQLLNAYGVYSSLNDGMKKEISNDDNPKAVTLLTLIPT